MDIDTNDEIDQYQDEKNESEIFQIGSDNNNQIDEADISSSDVLTNFNVTHDVSDSKNMAIVDKLKKQSRQEFLQATVPADDIIQKLSNNINILNNIFLNVKKCIQETNSMSLLYKMKPNAMNEMSKHVSYCQNSDEILSFVKYSCVATHNISNYYDSIKKHLNKNTKYHMSKLKGLKSELKECDETIKTLQMIRVRLQKSCDTTENCIDECKLHHVQNEQRTNLRIKTIEEKKQEVERAYHIVLQNTQHSESLKEIINNQIKIFENKFIEWNVNDVVSWIKIIENGYFECKEYESFINTIIKMNVNGKQLSEMNSILFLKMAGLNNESQSILLRNVSRVTKDENKQGRNICGFCTINIINTVITPCGHQYFCYKCSIKKQFKQCPICRKKVNHVIKTFMSGF